MSNEKKLQENKINDKDAGPSGVHIHEDTHTTFDPIKLIQREKETKAVPPAQSLESSNIESMDTSEPQHCGRAIKEEKPEPPKPVMTQENLERRLRIEEEVTFVCHITSNLMVYYI